MKGSKFHVHYMQILVNPEYDSGVGYTNCNLNDNIMKGAAKLLAPLPIAWIDNITGTTEVLAKSFSQYYSRHRGVFRISS